MILRLAATAVLVAMAMPSAAMAQAGGFDPAGMARRALASPFVGLTTDGTPQEGLFEVKPTGVDMALVRAAAAAFLSALTPEQRAQALRPIDDDEWRNWANIHRFPREGVSLEELSPVQREAAFGLLRESLSAKGYRTSRDIMRLNHHLAELVNNFDEYGEHLYWLQLFGEPSETSPWGWQIEGHHLIVNYFVLGDQVVMTPTFMGSEPVAAESGKYAGVRVFAPEEAAGLAFMRALSADQQATAIIGERSGRQENLAEMFKDNLTAPYAGLAAADLSERDRLALVELIGLFVANMKDAQAAVRMEEVVSRLDDTRFAWVGGTADDSAFYFRIHSPVIWIEFDHQGPIALDGARDTPTRRHVHTVVRTPNGGDYGKDLLRQHYEAVGHDPNHGHTTQ